MSTCNYCGNEIREAIPHNCKFCGKTHCPKHMLPESHECVGLKEKRRKGERKWRNFVNSKKSRPTDKKGHNKEKNTEKHGIQEPSIEKIGVKRSKNNPWRWLIKRRGKKYRLSVRGNHLMKILFAFAISFLALNIFYPESDKLNQVNLWIFNLAGLLLLTAFFFSIKYGWKILKEISLLIKRQRNLTKIILIIIAILLLIHISTNSGYFVGKGLSEIQNFELAPFMPIDYGNDSKSSSNSYWGNYPFSWNSSDNLIDDPGFLHYDELPITYSINGCPTDRENRINKAFDIIERETNDTLEFDRDPSGKMTINCLDQPDGVDYAGTGGPKYYEDSNRILSSEITLYEYLGDRTVRCQVFPVTEVHEILHGLGIGHIDREGSIMYGGGSEDHRPSTCNDIDKEIKQCLKYIYSEGEQGLNCNNIPSMKNSGYNY